MNRGPYANYVDDLKADLKSIAASGWGPELIPDDDIVQSQFPEVLEQLEKDRNDYSHRGYAILPVQILSTFSREVPGTPPPPRVILNY